MGCAFISIIVPVYNEELYLDACVGSMLAQDYPKESMEWFFVDGMSTDRTLERLEAYQSRFPGLMHTPKTISPNACGCWKRPARTTWAA